MSRRNRAERRAAERRRDTVRRAEPPLAGDDLDDKLRELGIGQQRHRAPGDRRDGADRRVR